MNSHPIISIITPTFNRANLLPRVWKSLQTQTLTNFQWIIVDDGSTDNTEAVISSFLDDRITYIYQENQGVNAARNRGDREVLAPYVVYLDSDDELFSPNTLEIMHAEIEQAPQEIGVVSFASIEGITGSRLSYSLEPRMVMDYVDVVCEKKAHGDVISIMRKKLLNVAPWPSFSGLESLRHWEIARQTKILIVEQPALIIHRSIATGGTSSDNLTGPTSAIKRAESMTSALTQLIQNHKEAWLSHCPSQYGRYLFNTAMYQALSKQTFNALCFSLRSIRYQGPKVKALVLISSLLLPSPLRQHLFVLRSLRRSSK